MEYKFRANKESRKGRRSVYPCFWQRRIEPQGGITSRATFECQRFTEQAVVRFGIDILTAYELTPYEITVLGKQYQEKQYQELENLIALAWHTEAFARQKKLPKLSKLIKDIRKKPKKQTTKSDAILKAMAKDKGVIIK